MASKEQGLNWRFTEIVPTKIDWTTVSGFKYCIYQVKKGKDDVLYSEGYVEFKTNKRLNTVRNILPGAQWSIRKGTALDAIAYCSTKFDNLVEGPFEIGVHSSRKIHNTQRLFDRTAQTMAEQRQSYGWILKNCPSEHKDYSTANYYNMLNWKWALKKGAFHQPIVDIHSLFTDTLYVTKLMEEATETTDIPDQEED